MTAAEGGPAADGRTPGAAIAPAASAEEAAAVVAALALHLRASAGPTAHAPEEQERWRRAAIAEGVQREPAPDAHDPWLAGPRRVDV